MNLSDMTVRNFIKELASDSPAPGGGSVAALAGALGAGLSTMVASLTVGKEKYKDNWDSMKELQFQGNELYNNFLELMEEDTRSFNVYMEAMKLPKDTDEQKTARSAAMQKAAIGATEIPYKTLSYCYEMATLALEAVKKGNPNAISDGGTAAALAKAAAISAAYNVKINLMSIKDQSYVAGKKDDTAQLLKKINAIADEVEQIVEKSFN